MIEHEFSTMLEIWLIKHHAIINIGMAIAMLCFAILWYKIYITRDGQFRHHLLWYFGSGIFFTGTSAILYHPYYNVWAMWLMAIPHFIALIKLSIFMIVYFSIGKRL